MFSMYRPARARSSADSLMSDARILIGVVPAPLSHGFQQGDRQRVDFLARRAAGDPEPDRQVLRPVAKQGGEDPLLEELEGRGIAEEVCYPYQHVLIKRGKFLGIVPEPAVILLQVVQPQQGHPPLDPANRRGSLVMREIQAAGGAEQAEDGIEAVRPWLGARRCPAPGRR